MTDNFMFEEATKEQSKARIALAGLPGSGKTMTSLIATTLFRRRAGSPSSTPSADRPASTPACSIRRAQPDRYDPRDLIKALAAAANGGYPCVIIDSLSKFWCRHRAGCWSRSTTATKRGYGGNTFSSGWKEARPVETAMIEAMLGYPGHVIVTMRTKTAHEIIRGRARARRCRRRSASSPSSGKASSTSSTSSATWTWKQPDGLQDPLPGPDRPGLTTCRDLRSPRPSWRGSVTGRRSVSAGRPGAGARRGRHLRGTAGAVRDCGHAGPAGRRQF